MNPHTDIADSEYDRYASGDQRQALTKQLEGHDIIWYIPPIILYIDTMKCPEMRSSILFIPMIHPVEPKGAAII